MHAAPALADEDEVLGAPGLIGLAEEEAQESAVVEAPPIIDADARPDFAEVNRRNRVSAKAFVDSKPAGLLIVLRICLQPFFILMEDS